MNHTTATAADVMTAMAQHASDSDAAVLRRFFKTGPGQYGEGDQFIGVRVPMTRRVCAQFRDLPLGEIRRLLASPIHEHRLAACIIMTLQAKSADDTYLRAPHDLYLEGLDHHQINNWDIIDTTCDYVIGEYAYRHDPELPYRLARSNQLWHKRAGMVMCFTWLKHGDVGPTLDIAELLGHDPHDLIQKAVGWLLRETGKRIDEALLLDYLDRHAYDMPRIQLRYAIERLPPETRQHYMSVKLRAK